MGSRKQYIQETRSWHIKAVERFVPNLMAGCKVYANDNCFDILRETEFLTETDKLLKVTEIINDQIIIILDCLKELKDIAEDQEYRINNLENILGE